MSEDEWTRTESARLRRLRFEAGEPVYQFDIRFTLDDIAQVLLHSPHSQPKTLSIRLRGIGNLQVVVESLHKVYQTGIIVDAQSQFPDLFLEGWVLDTATDYRTPTARVRMCLLLDDAAATPDDFAEGLIQRIPTNPDPFGIIESLDAS